MWEKEKMLVTCIFSYSPMFSTFPKTIVSFLDTSILSSANALNLERSKILRFGKGLSKMKQLTVCLFLIACCIMLRNALIVRSGSFSDRKKLRPENCFAIVISTSSLIPHWLVYQYYSTVIMRMVYKKSSLLTLSQTSPGKGEIAHNE